MEINVQHHASTALPLVLIECEGGCVTEQSGRFGETKLEYPCPETNPIPSIQSHSHYTDCAVPACGVLEAQG
jgi:hypothetical protein